MMPLDDEPWHGLVPPSSWTALGLSTSPSQGTPSWFAGQSAAALLEQISACPKREMSLSPWKLVHGHQQLFQLYAKAIAATATSSLRTGASSSRSPTTRVIFTDAEMEIIGKEKNLQELVNTEPKKVKR